jgi:hypothetical protein
MSSLPRTTWLLPQTCCSNCNEAGCTCGFCTVSNVQACEAHVMCVDACLRP